MIEVVHTKQGKSFLGLVAYLMEGSKGHEDPERVAWTATHNLSTSRPKVAAQVMAATALNQRRIMQAAGTAVRKKSTNHVLHYTLSWHQGATPSREEMMDAVHGSLAVLGETAGQKGGRKGKLGRVAKRAQFANEHQVLVVAHRDTPEKPHVHIVVNRVHPGHGVMLPTSNDYLKLSKWAEQFEREHGGLVVDARAIANAARDQGEKVYGKKRPPRDVYEAEKDARDNHPEALKIQTEQRTKDAALAKQSEATRTRCLVEWRALEATHKQRLADLNEETEKAINTDKWTIRGTFQGQKAMLMAQQRIETKAFEKAEESLIGRANNALRSLISLSGPVNVLWSQGARIEAFQRAQERKTLELEQAERRQKKEAETRIRSQVPTKRVLLGQKFQIERQELILRHQMEKAALRAAWKTRQAERTRVWDDHRQRMEQRPPEQSFGRQTTVADERTREMVKSAQELMKYQQRKAKEPRDHGRGGR